MKNEVLPFGTESLLNSLGWHLTPRGLAWVPFRSSIPPAGPDRLGAVMALAVNGPRAVRDLNCGRWREPAVEEGRELPGGSMSGIDLSG